MKTKGFPVTEDLCMHGAGRGSICEHCAGPVNFQLQLLLSVDAVIRDPKWAPSAELLAEAVRIRDELRRWATDREVCVKEIGPCACFRCAGGGEPTARRCPHDGGFCHHACAEGECFREERGMSLSTPYPGFPLPGHGGAADD